MTLLGRYLVSEFLRSSAAVLVGLLVTWVAADSLRRLEDLGEDAAGSLASMGLTLLDILPYGLPLACVVGAVWTLTRAVRHREVTAIRAGGIPLQRALLPLLGCAAALAVILGVVTDRAIVPGRIALSRAPDRADEAQRTRPRQFADRHWFARGSSLFSVGGFDPATRCGRDVTVLNLDEQRRVAGRIDAARACHIEGQTWAFEDVRVRRFDGEQPPYAAFAQRRIELGVTDSDLAGTVRSPRELSLHRLARAIREQPEETPDPRASAALWTALHTRLLEPVGILFLVLLVIPLGVGDVERGDSLPRALLQSLGWTLGFWLAWAAAVFVAQQADRPGLRAALGRQPARPGDRRLPLPAHQGVGGGAALTGGSPRPISNK